MTENNVIRETDNYVLTVGTDADGEGTYVITNKEYGVEEAKLSILGHAMKTMEEMEILLVNLPQYIETLKASVSKVQTASADVIRQLNPKTPSKLN